MDGLRFISFSAFIARSVVSSSSTVGSSEKARKPSFISFILFRGACSFPKHTSNSLPLGASLLQSIFLSASFSNLMNDEVGVVGVDGAWLGYSVSG